jgi:class 3 adenylate cyclase/tetratricopeptide (TPR) repeat protein
MVESASVYIPIDRREALARGDALPTRTQGAALLADISGFTPLTEALARELGRKRGAEELTQQLNAIYGAVIAEVDRYRGVVISFSGDAITCWFDGDDGARAAACALAMQRVMQPFAVVTTPSGATVSLAIKVAVAAGAARRFQVGDPAIQYIDTLAGATLDRLAAVEQSARTGEVRASPDVIERLGARLVTEADGVLLELKPPPAPEPWPSTSSQTLTEEQVRAWLLPEVYERVRARQERFLAELRPAVTLFVRFGGMDYDADEAAPEKLDAYIRWAQRIVNGHEGALLQLTFGDKGAYYYCAFGAPLAHDDDPARAVASALALRQLPAELSYITGVQIGISQGLMWTGPYGGPTRRTYGIIGDEVNLAARLMSQAQPGEILISQRIAEAAGRLYHIRAIGPMPVKGKQTPVVVSQVLERRQPSAPRVAALFANPLVGRSAELRQMTEALDMAARGQGQIFRIVGAAGVGKSHLAAELLERAGARAIGVGVGGCQSTTERTAYAPWRQIFYTLLRLASDREAEETQAREIEAVEAFIERVNPDWRIRLPLLGDLLGLPIPDNATTAAFEPRLRQSALFDLAVEMIQHWTGEQPLLLMIDDAHWMDEASQGLTLALGRALARTPLLLLLVHRPPLTGTDILPALSDLPMHQGLTLDELTAEGITELLQHKLGGPPGALMLSLLMAETQGNPFFVEELIDSLSEAGNLYQRPTGEWVLSDWMFTALQQSNSLVRSADGHWRLAPHVSLSAIDLGLPDSIQGVVLSRIDRLPQPHRLTLKVASVIGRSFAVDLLNHAHPSAPDEATLAEQVDTFEARDFTRPETPARQAHTFKHTVTRDVTYETLLFDQRRQLHRAVGSALEALTPGAVSQLAYHTFTGEDWERALRYQRAAGQQAQRLFVNHEGVEHFRKALLCAGHLPPEHTAGQRQQIHAGLGELLTTTGQYDQALEHLQAALSLAEASGDVEAQARACHRIAYACELRSEYALALGWIQKGLQILGEQETALTAELLALFGLIHNRQGNYELALERCEKSINVARQLNNASVLARAYNARAQVSYAEGNSTGAIEYYQRAAALYQQVENIQGQAMSYNGLGNSFQNMGRWPEASRYLRQAQEIFTRTGDVRWTAVTSNNLGEIARLQGRLDEALDFYSTALLSLEKIGGSRYVQGVFTMNLGATYLRRGDLEPARRFLHLSLQHFEQAQSRDFLAELRGYSAEAALAAGDLAEAEAQAQGALALARELQARGEEGKLLRVLADIASAAGRLDDAEAHLVQSIAILEEVQQEYYLARSQLTLAEVYCAQNRRGQSQTLLETCKPVLQRLDAALDLAVLQALEARLAT